MRVLAVDDNEDAVRSLGKILELDGYDVRVAFGGKAAVSTAIHFKPHAILLDIAMPDVTGLDVANLMHELPELGSILLVATTGRGDAATIRRIADAGIEHVLLKPVDLSKLRKLLQAQAAVATPPCLEANPDRPVPLKVAAVAREFIWHHPEIGEVSLHRRARLIGRPQEA